MYAIYEACCSSLYRYSLFVAFHAGSGEGELENADCVVHAQMETGAAIARSPQRLGCSSVPVSVWASSVLQGQRGKSAE